MPEIKESVKTETQT
jgi:hypothetical protein